MPARNIIEAFRDRTASGPDHTAHTFLRDGVQQESRLTYHELDVRARAIAAYLQGITRPGDRALMLYPAGLDFIAAFLGCLYARVVAIPACPARANQGLRRIESIRRDAAPSVTLSPAETGALDWDRLAKNWRDETSQIQEDSLAYLQYTSGSTSEPKGVMVRHGNLTSNLLDMDLAWEHDQQSILVSWLPHFHDMGLVYGMLGPLFLGIPGYLMSPLSFVQRPIRWLQAITHYRATHSVAPNFAYELCLRKIAPEDRASLDLSSWVVAVNGAEPVRKDTLARFSEFFEPCGFRFSAFCPGYGLAEATLKVTATTRRESPAIFGKLVGCGRPMNGMLNGTRVEIVDPESKMLCAPENTGEIWVSGPSVTTGYWNKPEANALTFEARIADTQDGPFLRTGDLGFVKDDHLVVTGRLKDLIIIRGQNHYPQDIERTAEQSHPALRQPGYCAAFAIDAGNEERLVVVQEVERQHRTLETEGVSGTIRQAIAETHELQAYEVLLVQAGALPRTSSGKIQRQACKAAYLEGKFQKISAAD